MHEETDHAEDASPKVLPLLRLLPPAKIRMTLKEMNDRLPSKMISQNRQTEYKLRMQKQHSRLWVAGYCETQKDLMWDSIAQGKGETIEEALENLCLVLEDHGKLMKLPNE